MALICCVGEIGGATVLLLGTLAVILAPGTGGLAPVGDQTALHDALREAITCPELRARRGKAARARVQAHYAIAQHAAGTAANYRRLLGGRRG